MTILTGSWGRGGRSSGPPKDEGDSCRNALPRTPRLGGGQVRRLETERAAGGDGMGVTRGHRARTNIRTGNRSRGWQRSGVEESRLNQNHPLGTTDEERAPKSRKVEGGAAARKTGVGRVERERCAQSPTPCSNRPGSASGRHESASPTSPPPPTPRPCPHKANLSGMRGWMPRPGVTFPDSPASRPLLTAARPAAAAPIALGWGPGHPPGGCVCLRSDRPRGGEGPGAMPTSLPAPGRGGGWSGARSPAAASPHINTGRPRGARRAAGRRRHSPPRGWRGLQPKRPRRRRRPRAPCPR